MFVQVLYEYLKGAMSRLERRRDWLLSTLAGHKTKSLQRLYVVALVSFPVTSARC